MSQTIVLIHGAWLTPAAWDGFKSRYEAKGYRVLAPAWPHDDRPVEELRRNPHPELKDLTIKKIVDHYDTIIRALPERPIIIGHSFGGLFTQLLLSRGLGAAGVAINPGAPRGVLPGPITLRTALPIFTAWRGWSRTLTMSFEEFCTGFEQLLPRAEQRALYDRHVVPTPGKIYFQAAVGIQTGMDYRSERAPLLLIASEKDRVVQPSMVRQNFAKQKKSPSPTELREYSGKAHFIMVEPGWEEVADYIIDWAAAHAGGNAPAMSATA